MSNEMAECGCPPDGGCLGHPITHEAIKASLDARPPHTAGRDQRIAVVRHAVEDYIARRYGTLSAPMPDEEVITIIEATAVPLCENGCDAPVAVTVQLPRGRKSVCEQCAQEGGDEELDEATGIVSTAATAYIAAEGGLRDAILSEVTAALEPERGTNQEPSDG